MASATQQVVYTLPPINRALIIKGWLSPHCFTYAHASEVHVHVCVCAVVHCDSLGTTLPLSLHRTSVFLKGLSSNAA